MKYYLDISITTYRRYYFPNRMLIPRITSILCFQSLLTVAAACALHTARYPLSQHSMHGRSNLGNFSKLCTFFSSMWLADNVLGTVYPFPF